MNVQPTPSEAACAMKAPAAEHPRRVPGGPRLFATWPIELEVEPWRP